mgnify:CR=1 FL=1
MFAFGVGHEREFDLDEGAWVLDCLHPLGVPFAEGRGTCCVSGERVAAVARAAEGWDQRGDGPAQALA